jgi:hypothetical protein
MIVGLIIEFIELITDYNFFIKVKWFIQVSDFFHLTSSIISLIKYDPKPPGFISFRFLGLIFFD